MHYELTHDSIARQINEKASAGAKARRKAKALVDYALRRYQERGILLTQDELDQIRPFRNIITISPKEKSLIEKSEHSLQKIARRKRQITLAVILALSSLLLFALYEAHEARKQKNIAQTSLKEIEKKNKQIEEASSQLENTNKNLDQKNLELQAKQDSLKIAIEKIDSTLAEVEKQKQLAEENARLARQESKKAKEEAFKAKLATLRTKASKAYSEILYETTQIEVWRNSTSPYKEGIIRGMNDSIQAKVLEGVGYCDKIISITPSDYRTYISKSEIYFEADRFEEAIQTLTEGIQIAENIIPLYEKRAGYLERRSSHFEAALKDFIWLYENTTEPSKKSNYLTSVLYYEKYFKKYDQAIKRIDDFLSKPEHQAYKYFYDERKQELLELKNGG